MRGWRCKSALNLPTIARRTSSPMFNKKKSYSLRFYATAGWLAWILYEAIKRLTQYLPEPGAPLNSDAHWVYIPNAKKILSDPWGFLTQSPESYHVAPMGYIWPALWGASPTDTQIANCAIFLISVILIWHCAQRLGGWWAGTVASCLLVYHPTLIYYIPQVLTESLYLFGLLLFTAATIEYVLNPKLRIFWLGLLSCGLSITLLTRPVLQYFALLSLAIFILVSLRIGRRQSSSSERWVSVDKIVNRQLCIALMLALLLPAATVIKNSAYFNVWGISTGTGAALYYGISPFKMGLEPAFSGFSYDASVIPGTADPETLGNPLMRRADEINKQVAIEIIKNTSLLDNLKFFLFKFKTWIFYSTPELRTEPKRTVRVFELMSIAFASIVMAWRLSLSKSSLPILPGCHEKPHKKLTLISGLLVATLGMAIQLTPVLYNDRYNLFFMEPWLIILTGVSIAVLLQIPKLTPVSPSNLLTLDGMGVKASWGAKVLIAGLILATVPSALTRYSLRYETWGMDPHRPGPTLKLLDSSAMGTIDSATATFQGDDRWLLESHSAVLRLPIAPPDPDALSHTQIMDAIWRLRFAVSTPPNAPRSCRKARVTLGNSLAVSRHSFPVEQVINLKLDATMHTYAIFGNDQLRPAGTGHLDISFACPPGTLVTWGAAELLGVATPQAARALIRDGTPINPYRGDILQ
nr:hypothetical protein [Delftia sp. PE138]